MIKNDKSCLMKKPLSCRFIKRLSWHEISKIKVREQILPITCRTFIKDFRTQTGDVSNVLKNLSYEKCNSRYLERISILYRPYNMINFISAILDGPYNMVHIGGTQTLFRDFVKFSKFQNLFGSSCQASKMSHAPRIWVRCYPSSSK